MQNIEFKISPKCGSSSVSISLADLEQVKLSKEQWTKLLKGYLSHVGYRSPVGTVYSIEELLSNGASTAELGQTALDALGAYVRDLRASGKFGEWIAASAIAKKPVGGLLAEVCRKKGVKVEPNLFTQDLAEQLAGMHDAGIECETNDELLAAELVEAIVESGSFRALKKSVKKSNGF